MLIRKAERCDLTGLLELYTQLHNNAMPEQNERLSAVWDDILTDKNHYILIGFIDERPVVSCVLIIVPNLTRSQRPYALIENVITDRKYRNKGCGTAVLAYAKDIAAKNNCYKIMLMTSEKQERTLKFYENNGYNRNDKTAFIQWL